MKKAIRQKEATKEQIAIYKKKTRNRKNKNILDVLHYYIIMDKKFKWMQHLQCGMEKKARALHLAVDKATKRVLYGWFDIQETTRAYFLMLMYIILNYGIPKKIKNR